MEHRTNLVPGPLVTDIATSSNVVEFNFNLKLGKSLDTAAKTLFFLAHLSEASSFIERSIPINFSFYQWENKLTGP